MTRYYFTIPFVEKNQAKQYGVIWDPVFLRWYTTDSTVKKQLLNFWKLAKPCKKCNDTKMVGFSVCDVCMCSKCEERIENCICTSTICLSTATQKDCEDVRFLGAKWNQKTKRFYIYSTQDKYRFRNWLPFSQKIKIRRKPNEPSDVSSSSDEDEEDEDEDEEDEDDDEEEDEDYDEDEEDEEEEEEEEEKRFRKKAKRYEQDDDYVPK